MVEALLKRNLKTHPQLDFPDYKSSRLRAPKNKKFSFSSTSTEISGPVFNKDIIGKLDNDLTLNFSKNNTLPIGHKIIVFGRISDQFSNPIEGALIEIWQANAAGKYLHHNDNNTAPIDPNFAGCGRYITSSKGITNLLQFNPAHIHIQIVE